MKEKKIAIIGVGGRTGTMFAFEFQKVDNIKVLGIGKDIEIIKNRKLFVQRGEKTPELFKGNVISDFQFSGSSLPDIIFLTTKNPVGPLVKYYYQKIKEKGSTFPALILSQNGIVASEDALYALKEVLGKEIEKVQVIRVSLFNPVDKKTINDKICMGYFLPIRLSFGVVSGSKDIIKIKEIFKKAGIEAEEILSKNVKNMEFSKLCTNLIGIPSAIRGLTIKEGFKNPEIFKEEIGVLREYIKVVRKVKGDFLNLRKAPIKLLTTLIYHLPLPALILLRRQLGKLTDRGRGGKPKGNLDEVDYYNGAVVKLGKEIGIPTPVNEGVLKRAKETLKL